MPGSADTAAEVMGFLHKLSALKLEKELKAERKRNATHAARLDKLAAEHGGDSSEDKEPEGTAAATEEEHDDTTDTTASNSTDGTNETQASTTTAKKPKAKKAPVMRNVDYSPNTNLSRSLKYHLERFTEHRTDFYKKRRAFLAVCVASCRSIGPRSAHPTPPHRRPLGRRRCCVSCRRQHGCRCRRHRGCCRRCR